MSSDRHPVLALAILCDPALVDVNVHPAKTEVRFRDPGLVRSLIVSAIHETLRQAGLRGSTTGSARTLDALRPTDLTAYSGASTYPMSSANRPRSMPSVAAPYSYHPTAPRSPALTGLAEGPQARFALDFAPPAADLRPALAPAEDQAHPLGAARAQLHETYIVAQTADGLVLVDQHAAHERLVYERLKRERARGGIARQGLLIPDVVEMAPGEAERLVAAAPELDRLGLTLEPFGSGAVLVREVPAALSGASIRDLVTDILDALSQSGLEDESPDGTDEGAGPLGRRLDAILSRMSCHGSIRAGRRLRPEEMNALLREMEATPLAGTCNHGRPTFVELKLHDIERLFGRR
jgi:DNA mismatch repair protein MutL